MPLISVDSGVVILKSILFHLPGVQVSNPQEAADAASQAKPRRRLLRRPERREQILAAATRAFAHAGFAATSLDDVAAGLGAVGLSARTHSGDRGRHRLAGRQTAGPGDGGRANRPRTRRYRGDRTIGRRRRVDAAPRMPLNVPCLGRRLVPGLAYRRGATPDGLPPGAEAGPALESRRPAMRGRSADRGMAWPLRCYRSLGAGSRMFQPLTLT